MGEKVRPPHEAGIDEERREELSDATQERKRSGRASEQREEGVGFLNEDESPATEHRESLATNDQARRKTALVEEDGA